MKIKKLVFGKEEIILPKEIEVEYEEGINNAKAIWTTIKALVKEQEQNQKKLKVLDIIKDIVPISFRYDAVERSYYIVINNIGYECSKEEYDSLKEALL